ncbi:MAG TPA: hypothetical protein VH583_06100 [Vicinamibacterales bacterium]|jgi:hypothetical protein
MPGTRKTWLSILIAGVIIVGLLAVSVVGGTAFFIYRHVHSEFVSDQRADVEFANARARFAGQRPLIEIRKDDEEPIVHRDLIPPRDHQRANLESLRVLAYNDNAGKIVHVSIPFWLLRLLPTHNLSFLNDQGIDMDIDSDRVRLTIDDLDRRGPGLLLDQKDRRGSQVLVWTE